MTTQITDHAAESKALLTENLKGKTNLDLLLDLVSSRSQDVETALWQLYTERWLDTAEGMHLDMIGSIVNETRKGLADDDYRQMIRARVLANTSAAVTESLISIVRQGVNDAGATIEVDPQYPGTIVLRVHEVAVPYDNAQRIANLLTIGAAAEERAILETTEGAPEERFIFAKEYYSGWADPSACTVTGNSIQRTSGGGDWNAGARLYTRITTEGAIEFSTDENNTRKIVGFNGNYDFVPLPVQHYDFAILLDDDGSFDCYRQNNVIHSGTYAADDVFMVRIRPDQDVEYLHNGEVIHVYHPYFVIDYPQIAYCTIYTASGTVTDTTVTYDAGMAPQIGRGFDDSDNVYLQLNGTSQYGERLHAGVTGFPLAYEFTLEAWLWIDPTSSARAVIGYHDAAGTTYYWRWYVNDNLSPDKSTFSYYDSLSALHVITHNYASPYIVMTGRWVHFAIRRTLLDDGSGDDLWDFFCDGVKNGLSDDSSGNQLAVMAPVGGKLVLGKLAGSIGYFSGDMDEVRVWNLARTDAQIAANYNKIVGANDEGLILALSFADSDMNDYSQYGNHLTETGSPTYSTSHVLTGGGGMLASANEG